ncbi:MAG TPA: CHAP domain-containing protein [Candidatus Dormibacteraeota bacterium]|nr:CHAP domain-containing protein [Candidatus Dormibacteraeota bacterium]
MMRLTMELQEFIAANDGRCLDVDGFPPDQPCQCVDVTKAWMQARGHAPIIGNAVNWWDRSPEGYEKIANGPTNSPSPGDIVVWGLAIGPFGHVAVAVEGDADRFTSFDQNWPLGSSCHRQGHNYNGVLGWFHEKDGGGPRPFTVEAGGGGALVRRLPGTDQPQVASLPEGTPVDIDAWCHHPPALSVNAGWPPDDRWFRLRDGSGWIASAVVYGEPGPDKPEVPDPTRPAPAGGQWTARAEQVNVRARPETNTDIVRTTGVEQLTFDAYCHSEPVIDPWRHQPDDRWCRLADHSGWVANAVVIGDPPADAPVVDVP